MQVRGGTARRRRTSIRSAHLVQVARLAVGREAHHLVLAVVDVEPEVGRDGAVEQAERVGEARPPRTARATCPAAAAIGRGRPLADAVHGQNRRLREAGEEEALAAWERWCSKIVEPARRSRGPRGSRARAAWDRVGRWTGRRAAATSGRPIQSCRSSFLTRVFVVGDAVDVGDGQIPPPPGSSGRRRGESSGSCLRRVNRSSCAAATRPPSRSRQQAESWKWAEMPAIVRPTAREH